MKYTVSIGETLRRDGEIEAETEEEAMEEVMNQYRRCDIVLNSEDYVCTTFMCGDVTDEIYA